MTNKEKAKEIGSNWYDAKCCGVPMDSDRVAEQAALEMAKWKEQQMIEYLYKNIQSLLKDYGVSEASADITTQLFLANFKQTMKEG